MRRSLPRCSKPQPRSAKVRDMDLGSAFAASVMRQPRQEAFVEGNRRMTYADWYREIASVAGGLRDMGLQAGGHLLLWLRKLKQMAALYSAPQVLRVGITPAGYR